MTTIIVESSLEDIDIRIRRIGRRVLITTPRPGVASSAERAIIAALRGPAEVEEKTPAIGFRAE